jgi:hypothetical protein
MTGWGGGVEVECYAGLIDRLARRLEDSVLVSVKPDPTEERMVLTAA